MAGVGVADANRDLSTVWAQLNFRESPLAIFTFGENAVGLVFLRFAKKASW